MKSCRQRPGRAGGDAFPVQIRNDGEGYYCCSGTAVRYDYHLIDFRTGLFTVRGILKVPDRQTDRSTLRWWGIIHVFLLNGCLVFGACISVPHDAIFPRFETLLYSACERDHRDDINPTKDFLRQQAYVQGRGNERQQTTPNRLFGGGNEHSGESRHLQRS